MCVTMASLVTECQEQHAAQHLLCLIVQARAIVGIKLPELYSNSEYWPSHTSGIFTCMPKILHFIRCHLTLPRWAKVFLARANVMCNLWSMCGLSLLGTLRPTQGPAVQSGGRRRLSDSLIGLKSTSARILKAFLLVLNRLGSSLGPNTL